jgi:hypothetical protein
MSVGRRILDLHDLMLVADQGRAVIVPGGAWTKKPMPAAFMIHQSGVILDRLLNAGIFIYEKEKKEWLTELR